MRIKLFPPQKIVTGGNHTTAARWVQILNSQGHDASLDDFEAESLQTGELGIFFNGAKSADRVLAVSNRNQDANKIIIVLSGTDLQEAMLELAATQAALDTADALVVYERSAMEKLSPNQIAKTVLVPHSSISVDLPEFEFDSGLNIVSVSHIRPQKNLVPYFRCLENFSQTDGVTFHHIGCTIDKATGAEVERLVAKNKNVVLHGERAFDLTVAMIRAADLLVHPSLVEGFPNVLVEAIVNRTAIAVSRIPVHTATFSDCLPTELFFDTDCGDELRQLLERFVSDETFRSQLQQACFAVADRFKPEVEHSGLVELLQAIDKIG